MATKQREFRTLSASSSTVTGNTLSGYIALFNTLSEDMGGWKEVLAPGCFTSSVDSDIRALVNHNTDSVVGRTSAGTLTLKEDTKGLAYSIELPDTQAARDLKISAERKDVTGCSFGFFCTASEWNDAGTVRTVKDTELFEVSVGVTFPAYADTTMQLRTLFPDGLIMRTQACLCQCGQCVAGACGICSAEDCSDPMCRCDNQRSLRADDKTPHKTVDGEVLHADDFLIVLDPKDSSTWNLPWKFSTEEKTKSHLRDALARFDQLEDVPEDIKNAAWTRLVELCKQHGIEVSPDDERDWKANMELRLKLAMLRSRL